ncbi:hypothetical protein QE152_g37346 [Popillia japonica]|uniref:Uncharacterized protein n=1 Tax=Popillia japonica TaxID=7064 RepID=A0AAW1I9X1_POPJA
MECNMEEIIDEMNERQIRKKNIILFGVREQSDDLDDDARAAAENVEVSLILKSVAPDVEQSNWKIFRLGKLLAAQARSSPIKAIMDNEEIAYAAMRKAKTLTNIPKYKNV